MEVEAEAEAEQAVTVTVTEKREEEGLLVMAGADKSPPRFYPSPLLSHAEISTNPLAFFDALRRFHAAMGTRLMVPVIGGRELNLHRLYVEVTRGGGLEKVIKDRLWREVIASFNFPPSSTSASFVLRKYYLNLLYHFEQLYFFRIQGPLLPPSAILQTRTTVSKLEPGESSMRRNNALCPRPTGVAQSVPANGDGNGVGALAIVPVAPNSGASISNGTRNFHVSGIIDGKFENGYFVTVNIGSRTLQGVLYHVSPLHQVDLPSPPEAPSSSAPITSTAIVPYIPPTRSVPRRRRRKYRDPYHPKPNRSAYNFFFADKYSKLKALYPHQERQYSKMIGQSWGKLTQEERKVYDEYGRRDKERYKRELHEYKESMKHAPARPKVMEIVRENENAKEVAKLTEVEMGESSTMGNKDG